MKHASVVLILVLFFYLGCIYDYGVRPDFYMSTAETFGVSRTAQADELPEEVDIDTCIRLVIQRNPRVEGAVADSMMAEYGVDIAKSYIIPKVRLEAVNTFTDQDIFAAYGWDKKSMFLAKISAQYLLWDFGISRFMLNQRYRDTDAARAGVRAMSDSLALSAAELYFTVKAMDEDIKTMNESIRSLEAQVRDTEVRYEAGMIPENQLLTLNVALEELKYSKHSLENGRYKTLLGLKGLMDYPADRELKLAPVVRNSSAVALPSKEVLLQTAFARRPEIIAAKASVDAAQMALKAAGAMRWPLFLIGAEMGYSDLDKVSIGHGGVNTQVAVSMSWDIYSGGEKQANVGIAREKLRKARLSLQEAETAVNSDVLSAIADIQTLRSQRVPLNLALASAQRNLKDVQLQYANQKARSSELVQAQSSLLSARSNLNKAEYAFLTALYTLEKSLGVSLESLLPQQKQGSAVTDDTEE